MQTPDRRELQKAYEDLVDEVLISIAHNRDREYQEAAVEVARSVLASRGVSVPDPDDEEHAGPDLLVSGCAGKGRLPINKSGKKLAGPFIDIPRFTAEEAVRVEELFIEHRVPYEIHPAAPSSCSSCSCDGYDVRVPEESFQPAVELLKDYYLAGLDGEPSDFFQGECPACGTAAAGVRQCTDCGLTLAVDYRESLNKHPFIIFLKKLSLLPDSY